MANLYTHITTTKGKIEGIAITPKCCLCHFPVRPHALVTSITELFRSVFPRVSYKWSQNILLYFTYFEIKPCCCLCPWFIFYCLIFHNMDMSLMSFIMLLYVIIHLLIDNLGWIVSNLGLLWINNNIQIQVFLWIYFCFS